MSHDEISIGISAIGILVGVFVAYHVHKLSRQKSFSERFQRRESIQKKIEDMLYKIRNGGNSKVELINVAKYDKYYPHNNKETRKGYTYIGAELKGYHFGGVEFFCEVIVGYPLQVGYFSSRKLSPEHEQTTLFTTGTIPYEWIESIDINGDDTTSRPQFYVHFLGIKKRPYTKLRYYLKDESTHDGFKEVKYKK